MSRKQRTQNKQRLRSSHVQARLTSRQVQGLLGELCVTLGFCLPPPEIERLMADPPQDSDEFTEAVPVAEGYGTPSQDRVVDQARELVAEAFIRYRAKSRLV